MSDPVEYLNHLHLAEDKLRAENKRLRATLEIVRVYIKDQPIADAVIVPDDVPLERSEISRCPSLRQIIDLALNAN